MGRRWLVHPLGVALAAPLTACLQSPPTGGAPACGLNDDVAQIALGRDHTCARLDNGGVWCWGLNDQGQLGDDTLIDRSQPSQVTGLRDVTLLAVGQDHSCALRDNGTLWCWGSGSNGQLGDGRTDDSTRPIQARIEDVVDVSLGDDFSCAVTGDGALYCWGENGHGQTGPDFSDSQPDPVRIAVEGAAVRVAVGQNHGCALLEDETVACWGGNDLGQLGDGTLAERGAGAPVTGLAGISRLASGRDHACALDGDGAAWCWGSNHRGQLGTVGDNPLDECANADGIAISCLPLQVDLGAAVGAVTAGLHHTCAVRSGGVRCWGGNESGQLGDGTFADSATPVEVRIEARIESLSSGETQTCATSDARDVHCWGSNRAGQLGETAALVTTQPAVVAQATGASTIQAGARHTCVQIGTGIRCWGANDDGQLGDQTLQARSSPTTVTALAGGTLQLAPGEEHTCVLNSVTRARCWGRNDHAELGPAADDPVELSAVTVDVNGDVRQLDSGDEHVCAVRVDSAAYCWGSDDAGQLGNGAPETSGPVLVELADVLAIACGDEHTCALEMDGDVNCWGANEFGQLGDGSTTNRLGPATGGLALGAEAIDVGDDFSCAMSGGAVNCWGANEFGQLGDGTTERRLSPDLVDGLADVSRIALGNEHACAITSAEEVAVMCWGRNDGGQLGDGTTESSAIPVRVELPGEPRAITAGERHTCALVGVEEDVNEVYCWGSDIDGILGSGRDLYFETPLGAIDVCR